MGMLVVGMVGEGDGMWQGGDVERRARRLRWMGWSWRKIAESLRGFSRGVMEDGVVNGFVHYFFRSR